MSTTRNISIGAGVFAVSAAISAGVYYANTADGSETEASTAKTLKVATFNWN